MNKFKYDQGETFLIHTNPRVASSLALSQNYVSPFMLWILNAIYIWQLSNGVPYSIMGSIEFQLGIHLTISAPEIVCALPPMVHQS